MRGMLSIAAGAAGAALIRQGIASYRRWRDNRNSLSDEERAGLFWNDRNYERLETTLNYLPWLYAAILAVAIGVFFLMSRLGY